MSSIYEPFLRPSFPFFFNYYIGAVLEVRLWVFHSCMTKSISKDFVLVFEGVRMCGEVCETSSEVIFLLRSMLGWCRWPRNGELRAVPVQFNLVNQALAPVSSVHFASCWGGLFFVSFANLLAPDGWRRFARQKHYSVGGHHIDIIDQPTRSVSNAKAKRWNTKRL